MHMSNPGGRMNLAKEFNAQDCRGEVHFSPFFVIKSAQETIMTVCPNCGVEMIGGSSAYVCLSCFKERRIISPNTTVIEKGAFKGQLNLHTIDLPESLLAIDEYAFYGCENLREILLPKGLLVIGQRAFFGCKILQKIHLPAGIEKIEKFTFSACTSLRTIYLSEGLTRIEFGAFAKSGLTEIIFPESLAVIEKWAFAECEKLESVKFLANRNLVNIDSSAFEKCPKLGNLQN